MDPDVLQSIADRGKENGFADLATRAAAERDRRTVDEQRHKALREAEARRQTAEADAAADERAFRAAVATTGPANLRAYLREYPRGKHAPAARELLAQRTTRASVIRASATTQPQHHAGAIRLSADFFSGNPERPKVTDVREDAPRAIPLDEGHTYLIVTLRVAAGSELLLSTKTCALVDGRGRERAGYFESAGLAGRSAWQSMHAAGLTQTSDGPSIVRLMFTVPQADVKGSKLRLLGKELPLDPT